MTSLLMRPPLDVQRDLGTSRLLPDDATYKVYVVIIPCSRHDTMVAKPPVAGNPILLQLAISIEDSPWTSGVTSL